MPQEAGIILRDQIFTFTPGGGDDGSYNATTPVVSDLKIDKASFRAMQELVDVSTAMDQNELMRSLCEDFEATFQTKLDKGIIRDLAVTFIPGGTELEYTAGTPLTTLEVNAVRLRQTNELVNVYTGQAGIKKYRIRKSPWTMSIETTKEKLASTGYGNLLQDNALIGFDFVHAPPGQGTFECEGYGRVEDWETNFDDVGGQRFNLRPHGVGFTLTHDDANSMLSLLIANALFRAQLLDDQTSTALDIDLTGIQSFVEVAFSQGPTELSWGMRPYGVAIGTAFA